jgi:hypothetical protein
VAIPSTSTSGFIYREAIAQEVMGQYLWRMATGPTVAHGRAGEGKGGKAGLGLQGMCDWQVHYGLAGDRVE